MKRDFVPEHLHVAEFAKAGGQLSGDNPLAEFKRLAAEAVESVEDRQVHWEAEGEEREETGGRAEPWIHLRAGATLPLTCQRCLTPVQTPIEVDRWFRFAADEESAAALDEELEDDVLVASRDFDLLELIEDELLMEVPITPRHEVCPQDLPLSVQDADFDSSEKERVNPFAALAKLRSDKAE
ncbi:DUF177 domain-containing protein [Variovorax sp. OV329]|uniref:YceD family protein n=1 Tax=Variovorax sp. OV329 TaxID=1882825 RepID=UPI0008E388A2|nr:DUF177 domain-containing protein [Variovorax sp. OV329]SFM09355.1 uncharacterized protein SAMN05444747_102410 [Variovorax sp. OV329]